MKSTRKILFTVLFVVLTLGLVACGDSKSYLDDTVKVVEANIPTSLNDGDIFSIVNPNPDHVDITWESSDEDIIAQNGSVTAQTTNQDVTIDVTFKEGKKQESKSFEITVNAKVVEDKTLENAKTSLTVVSETSTDLVLPSRSGEVVITWASNHQAITSAGIVTRGDADIVVKLTATLSYKGKSETKEFNVVVKAKEVIDTTLADAKTALVLDVTETENNLLLPSNDGEVVITWASNHQAITSAGIVTRGDADIVVKLTATLSYKGKSETKEFNVVVKAKEVIDTTLADAKTALVLDVTETENNLLLPSNDGEVVITWSSNNAAIASDGTVTRGEEDILVELTATLSYKGQTETKKFTVKVIALPDTTAPVLIGVAPAVGDIVVDLGKSFVLTVQAQDKNLYSLEVDHSLENIIPEFSVYANQLNPYGNDEQKLKFEQLGASISYQASTQTWTLDFGQTLTDIIIDNGGITFYLVISDSEGNKFGSMSPTTADNTFAFSVSRELDNDAPELISVTTPGIIPLAPNASFVWTVKASDKYLYSLEIDHSFEGTLPEFTVYASESNPYGNDAARALFESNGVLVTYDALTQTWTLDFGRTITEMFKDNGVTFYVVIKDTTGNVFGSMSPTSPENTFTYTFTGLPKLPNIVNGFSGYAGLDNGSFAMGPYNPANISAGAFLGFEYIFTNTTDNTTYKYFLTAQFNQGVPPIILAQLNLGLTPGNYLVEVVARGNGTTHIDSEPYTNGNGSFDIPFPSIEETVELIQDELVISWTDVDGLTYVLTVNGVEVTLEDNTYTFEDYGTYTVKLVVKKTGHKDLIIEKEITISNPAAGQLSAPTDLSISEEGILTWTEVDNASRYTVQIGTLTPIIVVGTTVNLKEISVPIGNHMITIVAKGDGSIFLDSESSEAKEYVVTSNDLPKLTTPLHAMGHTPNIFHLGIGPYDREDTRTGYSGKLRIVFTHQTTGNVVEVEINAGFGAASVYIYKDLNLPAGTYNVKFQAIGNQTTHQDSDFHPGVVTVTIEMPKLGNLDLSLTGEVLTWLPVQNATSYELFIDNESKGIVEGLSYVIDPVSLELEFGLHNIKVVAKAEGYQDSEATTTYEYINDEAQPLNTPNITLLAGELKWGAIEGAQSYSILVNGVFKQTVSSTQLSYVLSQLELNQGTYEITLIAKGNGSNNLDSLPSNTVEYESDKPAPQLPSLPNLEGKLGADFSGNKFVGHGSGAGYNLTVHPSNFLSNDEKIAFAEKFILEIEFDGKVHNVNVDVSLSGGVVGVKAALKSIIGASKGEYTMRIIMVAKAESGYRNSDPYTVIVDTNQSQW